MHWIIKSSGLQAPRLSLTQSYISHQTKCLAHYRGPRNICYWILSFNYPSETKIQNWVFLIGKQKKMEHTVNYRIIYIQSSSVLWGTGSRTLTDTRIWGSSSPLRLAIHLSGFHILGHRGLEGQFYLTTAVLISSLTQEC